jgi:glycine betaine/choline ABC-type transport system substrate-binding protein
MTRCALFFVCVLCLWACACSRSNIIVGSKNFTEQLLLGEIAAQQLERKLHVKVQRKFNLGGTQHAHQALVDATVDLYPEYTGVASGVVLKQPIPSDPVRAYIQVKDGYLRRFQLIWLPPLGFNATSAMAVRSEDAKRLTTPELSSAGSRAWRLGAPEEFFASSDGFAALEKNYPLKWAGKPTTVDPGRLYQALQQRKIDMAAGNSTDAQLASAKFSVIKDDKRAFPPYNACFVVRQGLIKQKPEVGWALSMLQNHISAETMRSLNRHVEVEHQPVETVVRDFLAAQP